MHIRPDVGAYISTVCVVVLVYDFLCTLDEEVAYVWGAPWSFGTLLFVVNRYLPFIDTIVAFYLRNVAVTTPEMCHTYFKIILWLITVGIIFAELILMLRTYAIWDRSRHVLALFCVLAVVIFSTAIATVQVLLESLDFIPVERSRNGCNLRSSSRISLVPYALILLSETTIVVLTMFKAFQHLRPSSPSWVFQLYKDGFIFFVYLLALTTINLVGQLVTDVDENTLYIFALSQHISHSIFCNRVILSILRQRRNIARPPRCHDHSPPKATTASIILSSVLNTYHTYDGAGTGRSISLQYTSGQSS